MIRRILLGAVMLSVSSGRGFASTDSYTFYDNKGNAYCDGITITALGGVAVGKHVYNQSSGCQYPSADIGGVEGTLPTLGPGKWYSLGESEAAGDSLPTDYSPIIYINLRALKWRMSVESTNYNIPFEIVYSGTLKKGAPSAFPGSKASMTVFSSAKQDLIQNHH